ncbi:MAG TPA: hypothetical protein VE621_11945 [Bryobacteraceae bacterium]|nr:hypothetical protein [Bryobacteraceae bacterium]
MTTRVPEKDYVPEEPPPFLGTWPRVYTAVLLYLVLVIAAMNLFSRLALP